MTATAERRITLDASGIARVEDVTLIAVAPATGLLPAFASRLPTAMPVLPQGTTAFAYDPASKSGTIVVSRNPQVVDFAVTANDDEPDWAYDDESWEDGPDGYKHFRLAMPYLHWVWYFSSNREDPSQPGTAFTFGTTMLYWSPNRLEGPTSGVMPMTLPNVYSDGIICWGSVASDQGSFASRIDSRIAAYFNTEFNDDLGLEVAGGYASFADWHEATEIDNYCWTGWPFYPSRNVEELIRGHGAQPNVPSGIEGWAPPPERFTIGRARDYARTLSPDARRRMRAALDMVDAEPETPAPDVHADDVEPVP